MNELIENIASEYSIADIEKLNSMLNEILRRKKAELASSSTLYKFFSDYEKYIENNLSRKYLKSVRLSFKHLILFFGDKKALATITVKDAEDFKQHLITHAPKGYANYLRDIRAAFNTAITWNEITYNPFAKIKFLKTQKQKPTFITRADLQKILDNTMKDEIKNIFLFAFNSGCRLGEIVSLKWKHIDIEKQIITIGDENFTTKTHKQRFIPINNELQKVLCSIKNSNPQHHVFCKPGGFPYRGEYISRVFKESRRLAGLPEKITFHTLRHSFASILAMRGIPLITIKELLGHSTIVTTQIYSHSNLDAMKDAVSKLDVQ